MDREIKLQAVSSLSDDELLRRLNSFVGASRRVEAHVIAHIAEVERRRLFEPLAFPSMHSYCTSVLHFSAGAAWMRIAAARAVRRFPVLLTMLADGRLHTSCIARLAPHLTDKNCEEVLSRAMHLSKRGIEELVSELAPKPDVPSSIRKLPSANDSQANNASTELCPGTVKPESPAFMESTETSSSAAVSPDGQQRTCKRLSAVKSDRIEPLAPARYAVRFTASAVFREKLERLEALMTLSLPNGELADFLEVAVSEKLERLETRRYGTTKRPRKDVSEVSTRSEQRYIPAPVRRLVRSRDGNCCTFVSQDGRRCTETRRLEFHHEQPYARGGDHSPDNVRLICRQHNMYLAELDYGEDVIVKYRSNDSGVRESRTPYGAATTLSARPGPSSDWVCDNNRFLLLAAP